MKGTKMSDLTIGIFYQTPDSKIAYTYGFDGKRKTVQYRFNDNKGGRTASYGEVKKWKPRFDLRDFPVSSDPKLPYIFDLTWDLKYMSDLRRALESGHPDIANIRHIMRKYNIKV